MKQDGLHAFMHISVQVQYYKNGGYVHMYMYVHSIIYNVVIAVMMGVMGDLKESRELFLQSSRLVKHKNNNLEKFCFRRVNNKPNAHTQRTCSLYMYIHTVYIHTYVYTYSHNIHTPTYQQAQMYKKEVSFFMPLEARLMIIEVLYLWRALPFCSEAIKLQLIEMIDVALPPEAQPFHKAMSLWLKGGILNSLKRSQEAEKVHGHVTVM